MHNEVEFKPGMQEMQCNVQKSIFIIHYSNIKKKKEPGDHLNVCRKKHLIKKKNFIIKTYGKLAAGRDLLNLMLIVKD